MNTRTHRRSRTICLLATFGLVAVLLGVMAPAAAAAGGPASGFRLLTASRVTLTYVDHKTHKIPASTVLKRGQQIDFTATVRPFATSSPGHVRWEVWGTRGGKFQALIKATSDPDAVNPTHLGQAGLGVTFNRVGRYSVRAMAVATSASLASAWTPFRNFIVR
jgi:hypothetical protein